MDPRELDATDRHKHTTEAKDKAIKRDLALLDAQKSMFAYTYLSSFHFLAVQNENVPSLFLRRY